MRLLVLGSGGKVGRLLRARWPNDSKVVPTWHGGPNPDASFDILGDPDALSGAISNADALLVLAGVTVEDGKRPIGANSDLAKAVLQEAGERPVFLSSSAAVYGRTAGPASESHPATPVSSYGRAKREMENAALAHGNAVALRIGNVAGADALLGNPRPSYCLTQFPDGGTPVRSYIGPSLLATAIARLASLAIDGAALPSILNVAAREPVAMADLLEAAGKPWTPLPAGPKDIQRVVLDSGALQTLLGEVSLTQDAAQMVADLPRLGEAA